ncbi:hypothetical protein LLS1_06140 [Leifsonia sp. LS1]|uniref:hypothetical protein n=1 Tax=Leifsonia sp. LS1 TaxID=2828483 RepID=UPI001CFF1464|nr:hypothetical protein [Leifsonia sp. LS1]GIT78945.1 hypothetical protein LLS1_06140 [Leifsonia sp. LS1]
MSVDPEEQASVTEAEVRVHRSPRYFRFMLTGAVLFAIVALVLTFSFPENPTYDRGSVFGFLLAIGVAVGVAVGSVVSLIVDRSTSRRARSVQADRIDVHIPVEEPEDAEPGETPRTGVEPDGERPASHPES